MFSKTNIPNLMIAAAAGLFISALLDFFNSGISFVILNKLILGLILIILAIVVLFMIKRKINTSNSAKRRSDKLNKNK